MSLSNTAQAVAVFGSAMLISLGAVSIPAGMPQWITVSLFVAGSIGFAIKEALGSEIPVSTNPSNVDPGFSVAAAKAAGFTVFTNSNIKGGYVLLLSGIYTDIYGTVLGSVAPAGTGSQI